MHVRAQTLNQAPVQLPEGLPPLMWAAARGDLAAVKKLLLTPFVKIDEKGPHGWTALVFAAALGQLDVVRYLLSQGARLTVVDKEGTHALMSALKALWPQRRVYWQACQEWAEETVN